VSNEQRVLSNEQLHLSDRIFIYYIFQVSKISLILHLHMKFKNLFILDVSHLFHSLLWMDEDDDG